MEPTAPSGRSGLPRLLAFPGQDVVGVGGDLRPATLLHAYRTGVFPMGLGPHGSGPIGWWCPVHRGVLRPDDLRVSRSLRKSARRYEVSVNMAFARVVEGCADPARPGRWITPQIAEAYVRLHELGWAHSVEVWSGDDLVGGLYGVNVGGLFAGESMFHRERDASKVALMELVDIVRGDGDPARLVDVQWATPHLQSLGVGEVERPEYLSLVTEAVRLPTPKGFSTGLAARGARHFVS